MHAVVFSAIVLPVVGVLSGCHMSRALPKTLGEQASGYTYIPVDPFPIVLPPLPSDQKMEWSSSLLLRQLPDNAVRVSIQQYDGKGNVKYGPVGAGSEGSNYKIIVDYINADTNSLRVKARKSAKLKRGDYGVTYFFVNEPIPPYYDISTVNFEIEYYDDAESFVKNIEADAKEKFQRFNIPVYIGVGLRVTANIMTLKGNVNISGLGVLSAGAEASAIRGDLVVQTLGINGKAIAAALPVQSELNQTTAQNAVVAIGSIKAQLYSNETSVEPRVLGVYLPFGANQQAINTIISILSRQPFKWERNVRSDGLDGSGSAKKDRI